MVQGNLYSSKVYRLSANQQDAFSQKSETERYCCVSSQLFKVFADEKSMMEDRKDGRQFLLWSIPLKRIKNVEFVKESNHEKDGHLPLRQLNSFSNRNSYNPSVNQQDKQNCEVTNMRKKPI